MSQNDGADVRFRERLNAEEREDLAEFRYQLGRWIGPVAERMGYLEPQGALSITYCLSPAEVAARLPWLDGVAVDADDEEGCADLLVEWRDGWVALSSPVVVHELYVPAQGRQQLRGAMQRLAAQLIEGLEQQERVTGTPWTADPRPPDGSRTTLRSQ